MSQQFSDSIAATADIIAISKNTLTAALEFFNQDDTPFDFTNKSLVVKFFFKPGVATILTEPEDYILDQNTLTFSYLIQLSAGCSFTYEIIMEDEESGTIKTLLNGKIIVK